MNCRLLGRTGLRVSEIGMGAAELGMDYGLRIPGEFERPAEEDAVALVHSALDAGVNYIDTARTYGASEEVLGKALRGRRNQVVLCTKCGNFPNGVPSGEALRRTIRDEIETSLRMLRTDHVDVMMVHSAPAEVIDRGEMLSILQDLRQEGLFRFTGATTYGEAAPLAAIRVGGWDVLQIAYSLLDQQMAAHVFPEAVAAGVGLVIRSVLYRGVLAVPTERLPEEIRDSVKPKVDALAFLVEPGRQSMPQAAIRFALSAPAVSTVLVGMRTTAHLLEALPAAGTTLSEAELEHIRRLAPQLEPKFQLAGSEGKAPKTGTGSAATRTATQA